MSTADDPRKEDLTTLGFGIGTLSYQCGSCGRIVKVDSYPLLAITGFITGGFLLFMVPLLFKVYPDFWHATLFAATILINLKLILTFLHLLYENVVYPSIEPWSKVIISGAVALVVAVPSAIFLIDSYEKRLLAFAVFLLFFGGISYLFIKGVATLVRCPAQQGWSFQFGDLVRVLIIAAIFGTALSTGDSSILEIIQ